MKILFEKYGFHVKKWNRSSKAKPSCTAWDIIVTEKVYITSKQMATFICPLCQKSKTVNVSKYANLDKVVKVKVSCPCGYSYTSILEKRKKYRKETNLPGSFTRLIDGRRVGGGFMNVRDISNTGLKIHTTAHHNCSVGDVILVEFSLDDSRQTGGRGFIVSF